MNQPKLFELKTWDKRSWALTEAEYKHMNERLEAGARFLTVPDDAQSKVAVADIKFFGKRQVSLGDVISEQKALPPGKPKEFDPLSPGYIKFLAMSLKLKRRGKASSSITTEITDEQRPLINKELEKMGIDYRV